MVGANELFLSQSDKTPMYSQIVEQVIAKILAGDWRPGQAIPSIRELAAGSKVRIPSDADQRSELMPIAIPISCRSPFQSDGDHHSNPLPISFGVG
jgi:GntR family transcriptional regulator